MKAFLALGILCLLFCLVWAQEKSVETTCSQYVLWVFVKKDLFGDGTFVASHELFLGFYCPVTQVLENHYELQYLVVHCGIRKMVYETYTRYDSTLLYNPWNTNGPWPPLVFSLTCILPRRRRIRNVHVSPPKSTPVSNQKNSPQKTEQSVSRLTDWDLVSCHLLGRNLFELLKVAQEMRDLLLTPHLISVVCWKQGITLTVISDILLTRFNFRTSKHLQVYDPHNSGGNDL